MKNKYKKSCNIRFYIFFIIHLYKYSTFLLSNHNETNLLICSLNIRIILFFYYFNLDIYLYLQHLIKIFFINNNF